MSSERKSDELDTHVFSVGIRDAWMYSQIARLDKVDRVEAYLLGCVEEFSAVTAADLSSILSEEK